MDRPPLRADQIETLTRQLAELPDRYLQAATNPTTQGPSDDTSIRIHRIEAPAPVNLAALDLTDQRHKNGWHGADPETENLPARYGTLPTLEAWVRHVRDHMIETSTDWPDLAVTPTVATESAWLSATLPYTLAHAWAPPLAEDVHTLHRRLGRLIGEAEPWRPPCPHCGNALRERDGGTWYACPACGATHTIDAALRDLGRLRTLTGPEVAATLGLSKHTIRSWDSRGILHPAGRDERGRKTYRIDEVQQIANRLS